MNSTYSTKSAANSNGRQAQPNGMTFETWRKMGTAKRTAYQAKCEHKNVTTFTDFGDLPQCDDCRGYGPWTSHPIHNI